MLGLMPYITSQTAKDTSPGRAQRKATARWQRTHCRCGPALLVASAEMLLLRSMPIADAVHGLGAAVVYVSESDYGFCIQVGEEHWQNCCVTVVPDHAPHRFQAGDSKGEVHMVLLEPEVFDLQKELPYIAGQPQLDLLRQRVLHLVRDLQQTAPPQRLSALDAEWKIFGATLTRRDLDPRIQRVLERIREEPSAQDSANDLAGIVNVSLSRLLHLFKSEVGIPLRKLRAWKRVRHFLESLDAEVSITELALETGHADLTHLSHSVRRFCGITPRDLMCANTADITCNSETK